MVGFGRKVRKRSREAQDTLAEAMTFAGEAIGATRTVQAFNTEAGPGPFQPAQWKTAFGAARRSILARSILTGFAIAMAFGSVVAVLWYGAQSVLCRGTLAGHTRPVPALFGLRRGQPRRPLRGLGRILPGGRRRRTPERTSRRGARDPRACKNRFCCRPPGDIRFDNVEFAYPARPDTSALAGTSFHVRPGETVAVVGASGAGKSTLFSLILRFYDATQGPFWSTRSMSAKPIRQTCAPASPLFPRT
jgi:ATP-binding cassette subfamily B protein